MNGHDHVIEALRRANPVPPGSASPDDDVLLTEILRSSSERSKEMVGTQKEASTPVDDRQKAWWPRLASGVAVVALVVGLGTTLPDRDGAVASDPARGDTPVAQMEAIRQAVDAINAGDYEELRSVFTEGGEVAPGFDFELCTGPCSYSIGSAERMQAWLSVLQTWGASSDIRSCTPSTEIVIQVRCRVATSFEALFMDWPSDWVFIFDPEGALRHLEMLGQPDAAPENQPLNWLGVMEDWTAWLQETHPGQAAEILPKAVTGVGESGYEVDGVWMDGVIKFDPAHAAEVSRSIEEYLETR